MNRKLFIKVFLISFLIFSLVIFTGLYTFNYFFNSNEIVIDDKNEDGNLENEEEILESDTPIEKAIKRSKRINILLLGLEGTRSDTIILASYDVESKKADLISIPRDTYYEREGYRDYSEFMKINSIYGSDDRKQYSLADAIENMTKIPIDKYVSIDYEGVRAAVDAVGGVEFNVPFHMKYTDPYDTPPLYIDIPEGEQIIDGENAMELLRFRKGNPGYKGYIQGDVGRIETQQNFIKAVIKKAVSLKLPSVISAVYPYVKTDLTMTELAGLAANALGFNVENLNATILPGEAEYIKGLSFYVPNKEEITKLLYELYEVPLNTNSNTDKEQNSSESENS